MTVETHRWDFRRLEHTLYDENIAHVRETIADINNRHPGLGGMIMFQDNEKAFDRVQHTTSCSRCSAPSACRKASY